jgi:hypothetical protein
VNSNNTSSINELLFGSPARGQTLLSPALGSGILDIAGFALTFSSDDVVASIVGHMNGPVGDLLVGAWDRGVAVREASRSTESDPTAEESVPLRAHGMRLTRRVQVVAESGPAHVPILDIRIQIDLRLNGAVVVVRGGRVAGVSPGEASAVGVFGYSRPGESELHTIEQWSTPVVKLPTYVRSAGQHARMITV